MKTNFFSFCLLFVCMSPGLPAQDTYQSAPLLPFDQYGTCGDMVLQTVDLKQATPSDYNAPGCMTLSTDETNDMWYKIVVPDGVSELSCHLFNSDIIPFPGSQEPAAPALAVYDGNSTSNLQLLECFSAAADDTLSNAEIRWADVSGISGADTLYLRVWDQNNTPQKLFLAVSERMDYPENYCETPASLNNGICNILSESTGFAAPEDCGWNVTDNPAFYHFTVTEAMPQPVSIVFSNLTAYSLDDTVQHDLQIAVYSWNGMDCTNLGGSPYSDPANTSGSYMGCLAESNDPVFTQHLSPGQYMLVVDGYSGIHGKSMYVADADVGTASIDDGNAPSASVYPNPTTGELVLQSDRYTHCTVYNPSGQKIGTYQTDDERLNLKSLPSGLYTIRFFNDSAYEIRRVVLK